MSDPLQLISDYLDNDISDAGTAELETWLLADPSHVDIFARQLQLHSLLRDALAGEYSLQIAQSRNPELSEPIEGGEVIEEEPAGSPNLNDAMMTPAIREAPDQFTEATISIQPEETQNKTVARKMIPRPVWLATAAIILVAIGIGLFFVGSQPAPTLEAGIDTAWDTTRATPEIGKAMPASEVQLNSGLARIKFATGAEIVVEAPALFKANARNGIALYSGKLTAIVPAPAHGFTVNCPGATVIDLGTEFGMNVHASGSTDVDVFKGSVTVAPGMSSGTAAQGTKAQTLTAGSAGRVAIDQTITPIASNPAAFFRRDDFDQLLATSASVALKRWQAYRDQLRSDPNLVAYYTFERSNYAPRNLANRSIAGAALDGVLGGDDPSALPDWTVGRWPGKSGLAFMPGTSQHVALPDVPEFDFSRGAETSSPFTLCAWIKPSASGATAGSIVCRGSSYHEQYAVEFPPGGGGPIAWVRGQSNPLKDTTHVVAVIADSNAWHFVVEVYDAQAGELSLYVDGQLAERKPATRQLLKVSGPVYVGSRKHESEQLNWTFNGSIDELSIFKKALRADEIMQAYIAGKPG